VFNPRRITSPGVRHVACDGIDHQYNDSSSAEFEEKTEHGFVFCYNKNPFSAVSANSVLKIVFP
jgi:hypothetical protein